jgi:hypothetical protein
MPENSSQRRMDLSDGQLFSDLFGIKRDLELVMEFCRRLSDAYDAVPTDYHLIDALSTASVVRYCRCFEVGVRAKIARESITAIDPRFVEFHDYLFALRQKHLSHSVNEFEENCVTVAVSEPPDSREVLGIGIGGGRVAGLDKATARNLEVLARKLYDAIVVKFETERGRIQQLVTALPIEEIYALPMVPPFQPDWRHAANKRRRREPMPDGDATPSSPKGSPELFLIMFAPQEWTPARRFSFFLGPPFSISRGLVQATRAAENRRQKHSILAGLAKQLRFGLTEDYQELESVGFTSAARSKRFSAVVETMFLELYSSLDAVRSALPSLPTSSETREGGEIREAERRSR